MSICTSLSTQSAIENVNEIPFNPYNKKTYVKMEFAHKVQIIGAVEKGQTKVDIAREYGVHPRTIAYIYKQKDNIFKKQKQKYTTSIDQSIDLSIALLNWFEFELSMDRSVTEVMMQVKAEELAKSLNHKKLKCTKQWMTNFRKNHNIITHSSNTDENVTHEASTEWAKIIEGFDENDIYVATTCALLHSDNWQTYITGSLNVNNQLSALLLTNVTGTDKKELLVVGRDPPPLLTKSLPLKYCHKENPLIDDNIIANLLIEWDNELKTEERKVLLGLMLPDSYLDGLELQQIKLINSDIIYVSWTLERITNCFKYHYRRLQIMQTFSFSKNEPDLIDYIRLLSLAWHSVSRDTVRYIFHPRVNGCLYFKTKEKCQIENEENDTFNLSEWCATHGIPLQLENNLLDKFMLCDKHVKSLDDKHNGSSFTSYQVNENIARESIHDSPAAIDAFQAAKRLLRYLQSESSSDKILKSGKLLEDHLEYKTCIEIQEYVANNSTIDVE